MPRFVIATLRRRLAEERGVSLVEVMVSALLLVVAGGGLLSAIDAAGKQSNEQRSQAVAADIAQAEMERLTGLRFADVDDLNATTTKTVGGTTFTIQSQATWALQTPQGSASCNISGRSPEALRLTSTVTWPRMNRRPVSVTTMRAAPTSASTGKGSFIVQIVNRSGAGIPSIGVAMAGATPMSGSTDASGCVRFNEMDAGTYVLSFNGGSRITPEGLTNVSEDIDVVGGQTRSAVYELDTPGALTITAFRFFNGGTGGMSNATIPPEVSLMHASLAAPIVAPVAAQPWTKTGLYPFTSAYGVYADDCTAAQPPAGNLLSPVIAPGATTTVPLLHLPGLDIRPTNATTTDRIYVRTVCGNILGPRALINDNGMIRRRDGYPYGTTQVCIVRTSTNPDRWVKKTVDNDTFDDDQTVQHVNLNNQRLDLTGTGSSTSTPTCGWAGFVAS